MGDVRIEVLLIDDDNDFIETMRYWLSKEGYIVRTANSGREGLQNIKDTKPDIVFLDLKMPEVNGIEALKLIREYDTKLPVIMITAYGTEKEMARATELGISGFFPKTSDFTEAVGLIKTATRIIKKPNE